MIYYNRTISHFPFDKDSKMSVGQKDYRISNDLKQKGPYLESGRVFFVYFKFTTASLSRFR